MIKEAHGNLLEADTEALVNTVNCKGYMGKGVALQFKQAFPENFKTYERACQAGEVRPGRMFVFETGMMMNPRYIINFPTKRHWRGKSRMDDIEAGLTALVEEVRRLGIRSIALPPLGCGNGGLDWAEVRPRIEAAFAEAPEVEVHLFVPQAAPAAGDRPIRTKRPRMTTARALFIKLMDQYSELDYRLSLLELQKLAYFLQEAGEPLRLHYEAGPYGPYAPNLGKVLETMEGHFTSGYRGDQQPDEEIALREGSSREAESYLEKSPDSRERLTRVTTLITGFETPYGLELLSSLHWLAWRGTPPVRSLNEALQKLTTWSERKRDMFKARHVEIAWERLKEVGWLPDGHETNSNS